MKKLLKLFSFGFSVLAFNCIASAGCITRHIGNNTICVDIEKGSNNRYNVESRINCNDYDCAVNCSMILPDGTLQTLGTCNGRFTYNGNSEKKVKMYITINNDFDTIEAYYDFGDGERGNEVDYDDDWDDDDDDRDDDENDYIDLDTNDDTPSIGEYVNISIETDEDYVGKIYFSAKYRSSTSSSRSNISSTSSTYFTSRSTTWDNGYTSMSRSNYGSKNISNIFKFAKRGYYRIYAEDEDGNTTYLDFNVGGSSSSSHDLEVSADDTSISTSEYAKLYIQTDEDYIGKINFALKYRSSTSSSRSNISSLTNSTYVSNYSSTRSQGYYKMLSSDAGEKTLSNLVKFRKTGYYRITLTDIDGNSDYVDIHVSSNSSSSSYDLEVSADDTSISTSEYAKLYIQTDEDYIGKINFALKYRSSTSSSRSNISSLTNSTYVSNYSSTRSQGYYKMLSSDAGEKTLSNLVKFRKTGYYRITLTDIDGNSDYVDIHVSSNSSSSSYDLEVSADDTSISTSEYAKLYIQTDEDYIGKINFALKYRSSTSSSRSNISSLTNSTYVSNYSSTRSQGYYKMLSSDAGEKTLSNLVKFRKTGYYRITLTDIDGNSDYVDIHVSSNSSSSEGLEITSDDVTPDTSDYIDIVILTDEDYVGTVEFSAKYKSSYSDTWTSISRTSSTYFKNRSTTWDNGYINMRSSDRGEKSISNIFKFAKKGYFRIYAEDEDGNSSYLDFNVGTLSPLEGFTQKEFETVSRIYNIWPVLISKLKSENPSLARNTSWINLSNELYDNMGDVVNMRSNREFMDYDDFDDAFQYRYRRTLNLID